MLPSPFQEKSSPSPIRRPRSLKRTARVSFGGILKEVCLAYTPEAKAGDYVIVHVGFALNTVDEQEAERVFEYLQEMDELAELEPGAR